MKRKTNTFLFTITIVLLLINLNFSKLITNKETNELDIYLETDNLKNDEETYILPRKRSDFHQHKYKITDKIKKDLISNKLQQNWFLSLPEIPFLRYYLLCWLVAASSALLTYFDWKRNNNNKKSIKPETKVQIQKKEEGADHTWCDCYLTNNFEKKPNNNQLFVDFIPSLSKTINNRESDNFKKNKKRNHEKTKLDAAKTTLLINPEMEKYKNIVLKPIFKKNKNSA